PSDLVNAYDIHPIGRHMPPQRRTGRLALAKLFLAGKGEAAQVGQIAVMLPLDARTLKFVAIETRTGEQVVELFRQLGFLQSFDLRRWSGFYFRIEEVS